jgi:hypothetical protein
MHSSKAACVCLTAVALSACAKSPSSPSGSPNSMLQGQAVSALDGSAEAGVQVQVGPAYSVTTDGNGYFQADVGAPGTYATRVTGNAIVERRTSVNGPSGDRIRLSLIPSTFDLTAFDQLARTTNGRLQRWTTQPALVVLATTMTFNNNGGTTFTAAADSMTDAEVDQLIAHMTEGLALLTGGTYAQFAAVDVERPKAGDQVAAARDGKIVVGRYTGISAGPFGSTQETIGYGIWKEQADGRITGGSMFLDHDFDRNDSRRRLLRIHELGHALGYLHVTARASVMNPTIGPEPSDFDRFAAGIIFQRPPGNTSPDTDPGPIAHGLSEQPGRWTAPIS